MIANRRRSLNTRGGRTCSCSVTHPVEILELAGEKWGGLDVENP